MRVVDRLVLALSLVMTVGLLPAGYAAAEEEPGPAPSPFVICNHQRYALCASASCFVYNGVAYCQCDILKGNSISLQLDFSTPTGQEDVCDVNAQGRTNGYMVSTYSLPSDAVKGGTAAVYTCPGMDNAGSGQPAPVAYGQCDGGFCFTSTTGKEFPGFDRSGPREIICSCPISTGDTKGSSTNLGYQIFGPYHPKAPVGKRCDPKGCSACNVANPTDNGSIIPVGAPTGAGRRLTELLTGSDPELNECLCECPAGGGPCTLRQDISQ